MSPPSIGTPALWVGFLVIVLALLAVDLGVEKNELDKVAAALKAMAGFKGIPKLEPIPLLDGSAEVHLFLPTGERIIKVKPALYGDSPAVFSVNLDGEGAVQLERALKSGASPILIAYSLDFLAVRPKRKKFR